MPKRRRSKVKKESITEEEVNNGVNSIKRMKEVHDKTTKLTKLSALEAKNDANQKDHECADFEEVLKKFLEVNPNIFSDLKTLMVQRNLNNICSFCENETCLHCCQTCRICKANFCNLCSVKQYDIEDTSICLSCLK